MAKKSFKLVKASAALAVTAAALTPVMAAEASTSVVELKAEVVLGGKFKEALALNTPAGVQITWGKHLVTAINKWQTVKGQGSDGKTYIKKLYARNYPLYVLDQDLGEVEAGSELEKPSIRVMYRDGKIYTQAPERYTMSSNYNTKDEGEQKVLISYNHNGNRVTKMLTYTVVASAPVVEEVKAVDANTVELSGVALDKLKAEQFSLEGNKVTSYSVNKETGVATLKLEKKVESGKEQTLKLKETVEGEEKVSEFKFTYTLEVKSLTANPAIVDNDTADQVLTFQVNDEVQEADLAYLKAAGYKVKFLATSAVFVDGGTTSENGKLLSSLAQNSTFAYKVQVLDKEDKVVAESALAEVKVVDKSQIATSINSYKLLKGDVELANPTVVVGESVTVSSVLGNTASGGKDVSLSPEFTSSNRAVALINATTGVITPIQPGVTTITLKSGDVTKTFNLTVASAVRVATSGALSTSSLKLVDGQTANVGITVKDQYGEVVSGQALTVESPTVKVNNQDSHIVSSTGATTDAEGKASIAIEALVAGSGVVKVKAGAKEIASFSVAVSSDKVHTTNKLELADASKDATLDLYAAKNDASVQLKYNQYNAAGYLVGAFDFSDTKFTVHSSNTDVLTVAAAGETIAASAVAPGTAKVIIKEGAITRAEWTVNVVNTTPVISNIVLKDVDKVVAPTTLSPATVLTLKAEAGKNPVVENITLSSANTFPVRLADSGKIYLDADNDGALDSGELVVGNVSAVNNFGAIVSSSIETPIVSGNQGTVVYTVKRGTDATGAVIATSVIEVKVPAAN